MSRSTSRVVFCLGLLAFARLSGRADTVSVTVDGARTYQVIEGFGVNANHRSWNNNELKPVLDALIDQGGMTLFRVILDKTDWEVSNDNSDPNVMDWSYYNQVYGAPDFQKLWAVSAYLNQRGITNGLMFNFQGTGPGWMMDNGTLAGGYEAEWAEMIASLLIYARNTEHLQFTLVGPNNEQDNLALDQGVNMDIGQYVTALHTLAELLDAHGLNDLRFVGPDLAYTSTDWLAAMMDDPVIMAKLAHVGLHSYQDESRGSSGIVDFLQQSAYPDLTYWMTEFNVWCDSCNGIEGGGDSWDYASGAARYLLYHLAYGASAAMAWEGYDSQYNYYNYPGGWSFWGLFAVDDTNAASKTYTPRKTFFALSQISKFVRPGAWQIDVTPWSTPPLDAFYHPDSGQLTITGLNPDADIKTLSGTLANLPPVASLDLYYTDPDRNLCYSDTFPVTAGSFTATVPANCVFTLVGFDPARIAVSVLLTDPPAGACYAAPATIPLEASALTTTGSISQVVFYCGTTKLGEAVAPPYSMVWPNVMPGTYLLSATATNFLGNYGVSPDVQITVFGPAARIAVTPTNATVVPYGTQQFSATVTDALGTPLVPQPPFTWSASGGTITPGGLFTAGGHVGGPFTISASTDGVNGTASVSIATDVNVAPLGVGYTWYSLDSATTNRPEALAQGINDGDLTTDVSLVPGGAEDTADACEAAGVVWPTPQTINRVVYVNGSYNEYLDGVFAADFGLQFSPDGTTWTDAGAEWDVEPAYVYNSADSAHVSFTFTGAVATVRGVRCLGRVHTSNGSGNSWVAFATEVEAFAAPVSPPAVSVLLTKPADGAYYTAPATILIQASPIANTGSISQVEFFCGTTNLGEVVSPPYDFTWSNVPPGTYVLSASATNSLGDYGVSPGARVTVVGPVAQISIAPTHAVVAPYGTTKFTATAADALGTVIVPPPAFDWSVSGGGTIDGNGLFTAGGSVGGPFTVAAANNGVTGAATVWIAADQNLGPAGEGYTWYSLTAVTDNSPQAFAPGINDGDLNTDVPLVPGGAEDEFNAYEAAGVIWTTPQTVSRVLYKNGSYDPYHDGVFADEFGLQFSPDGTTWTAAGPGWTVTPLYLYNSSASADAWFTFTGGVATVRGVRCVGRVHTADSALNSWIAFATEVQAFAAVSAPPPVLTVNLTSNSLVISWAASVTNYVLEAATNLTVPASWSLVTNASQPAGELQTVIVPLDSDRRFFRLHRQ